MVAFRRLVPTAHRFCDEIFALRRVNPSTQYLILVVPVCPAIPSLFPSGMQSFAGLINLAHSFRVLCQCKCLGLRNSGSKCIKVEAKIQLGESRRHLQNSCMYFAFFHNKLKWSVYIPHVLSHVSTSMLEHLICLTGLLNFLLVLSIIQFST